MGTDLFLTNKFVPLRLSRLSALKVRAYFGSLIADMGPSAAIPSHAP